MVVVAVVVGVLPGCAAAPSASSADGGTQAPAGQSTATGIPSSGLSAEALDFFFPATGAELTAGAQFNGTMSALEGNIAAACMARSGFNVPGVSAAAAAAQSVDNGQFPDLAELSSSGTFVPYSTGSGPRPLKLPSNEQKVFGADLQRCTLAARKPFAALMQASGATVVPWLDIVTGVQSSAPVQAAMAGFRSCVGQAGTPQVSAGSFDDFLAWVTALEAAATTQRDWIAINRRWVSVFVRCARTPVAVQERLQSAQRTIFMQKHYQQVHELQALASDVVTRVERQLKVTGIG
jgi:hypothetical protein